jgi:hypothetical protein
MQGLRAFVGHSFSDQDKALINIFCEHVDKLAKAHLGFTWDHAVEAEPAPLSNKVLAKIEGKNVFIGICIKNELAIRDTLLRPIFLRKDKRTTDRETSPSLIALGMSNKKVAMYFESRYFTSWKVPAFIP